MTVNFIYELEYTRVFPAIILDSRFTIPSIYNKDGWAAKAYIDGQMALITQDVAPYRIETTQGAVSGYMTLKSAPNGYFLYQLQLRPAFQQFLTDIQNQINTFIASNSWQFCIL